MRKNILRVVLFVGFSFTAAVWAEEPGAERNPFLPGTGSPGASDPSSPRDDWGRDPFSNPLGKGSTQVQRPKPAVGSRTLYGIIYGDALRLAIFGDEILREGDRIGSRRLSEIRRMSIILMDAASNTEEIALQEIRSAQ